MKKLYLLFLWGISFSVRAQTISSAVIASGGNYLTTSTVSLSSTIGQSISGNIAQNNVTLHQGFQVDLSGNDLVTAVIDERLTLNIYPNPVSERLLIEGGNELSSYSFQLVDMSGKPVGVKQTKIKNTLELNVATLPPAQYLLRVQRSKTIVQTISIIKSN